MKSNQNYTIGQVIKFLNGNGCLVWRYDCSGRIDEDYLIEKLSELFFALAHVKYDKTKISGLIKSILSKSYRSVPNSKKGVPDVIGFYLDSGRWITVEVKCGSDRLRPEQEDFIDVLRRAGGDAFVCYEFESFRHFWQKPGGSSSSNKIAISA